MKGCTRSVHLSGEEMSLGLITYFVPQMISPLFVLYAADVQNVIDGIWSPSPLILSFTSVSHHKPMNWTECCYSSSTFQSTWIACNRLRLNPSKSGFLWCIILWCHLLRLTSGKTEFIWLGTKPVWIVNDREAIATAFPDWDVKCVVWNFGVLRGNLHWLHVS